MKIESFCHQNTEGLNFFTRRLSNLLVDFFSKSTLEICARKSGFVQRNSKLKAWMFIDVLLFQMNSSKEVSLLSICNALFMRFGIKISKQSINERFNEHSVFFLKELLHDALSRLTFTHFKLPVFKEFTEVNVKDSTRFGLPSNMKNLYPGNNTKTSESVANLQLQYDLKTNTINELSIQPNTENDYKNAHSTIDDIKKGSLIVRDLGYVSVDLMQKIDQKEAFYLNRIKPQTSIYEKKDGKYIKLSLKGIRLSLKKSGKLIVAKDVFIGHRKYHPCRIIISLIPEEKAKIRRQKQKRKSQKRGAKTTNPNVLALADLNIFVTNTTEKQLPIIQVYNIYKLRWQIELIFKSWKQVYKFHNIKEVKPERLETMLFAQILWVVINWSIISIYTNYFFIDRHKYLSFYKACKTLQTLIYEIRHSVYQKSKLKELFKRIEDVFSMGHFKDKRKGVVFSEEILLQNTI
ncbi:IS4 family transposase [Labilibacter sediminis]|nr:IS4 family transposase [Labilibacter sediminis]